MGVGGIETNSILAKENKSMEETPSFPTPFVTVSVVLPVVEIQRKKVLFFNKEAISIIFSVITVVFHSCLLIG